MQTELKTDGEDIAFVVIAQKDLESFQHELVNRVSFPLFQDTTAVDAWALHGGGKDDLIVYDTKGTVAHYLKYGGTQSTNLSDAAAYAAVKKIIVDTP